MDAISENPINHPSREDVSLRPVTGRRRRRFSLPSLPTERLCLDVNPHDANPMRKPVQLPLARSHGQRTGIENMGERAARWKANAAYHLAIAESSAHRDAMRLQEASAPPIAAARPALCLSRNYVQGASGRNLRKATRPASGLRQSQPQPSQRPAPVLSRSVTFSLPPDHVEELRTSVGASYPPPAPTKSRDFALPDVQSSHATGPSRNRFVPPLVRSNSPGSSAEAATSRSASVTPVVPTMLKDKDLVQEAADVDVAGVTPEVRTDSVMSPEELNAEANGQTAASPSNVVQEGGEAYVSPQEGIDDEDIAASYLGYQSFLEDDEDIDRGRRRRRGNVSVQ